MNHLFQLMKRNILYILLIMLIISLTLLLLIREEKVLTIITKDYPYSIYHSDNYETIDIELLSSLPDSYHFDSEYIISARFFNIEEEFGANIKEITKSSHEIQYNDQTFYQITFEFTLPFSSNDYLINMEEVYLELIYENMETITLSIGEINYLFKEDQSNDISLSNLSATHEEINGFNTIGGINLELSNSSQHNIMITSIQLLSNSVYINEGAVVSSKTCEYTSSTSDCLGIEYYDFTQEYNDIVLSTLLGKNNTIELYLPLIYEEDAPFIYEFSLLIEYEMNNHKGIFVLDNFPYMKTSIFNNLHKGDFNVYVYSNSN